MTCRSSSWLHGVRAPLGRVALGAHVREQPGLHSDDRETVTYKELKLSMGLFRQFVHDQVQHWQMARPGPQGETRLY